MTEVYWLERSGADLPAIDDWLSAGEVLRLDNLRFAKRRADWRLGRWTAKRAVAALLNLPHDPPALARLEIRPANSGAPEVYLEGKPAPVTISLSHCSGVAACAVAGPGVVLGCDLEAIEPRDAAFIADYFAPEEQALVAQASAAERWRVLTLLWSGKESALKALREGLRLDTRCVIAFPADVDPKACEDCWRELRVRHVDGQVFSGWWRNSGSLLRTVLAAPPPMPPILLNLPT